MNVYTFLLLCFCCFLISYILILKNNLKKLSVQVADLENKNKNSLSKSRSVIKGQLTEQLFPILQECPYETSDMKFFGQPFDYIVLKGYTEGSIEEVIFVEVKTGSSKLSAVQRSMRDAIDAGKVSWQTATIKR